ncbi:WD repeat-containing protein 20 isoform X8 [Mustela erminea]|uniref:WD repeat-containing protein 20 isoform X8 n=1 Tax=Mustela erminea TaxID=36723 RepID=UPI001386B1DF|nr:WD repeat-containing protein 20 isoform X8 [Mustela erminea]
MATEGGGKEMNEIKTQFTTREGLYKLLPHSEYSRPNRVPFNSQGSNPVRVSFVNLNDQSGNGDRLCFNVGRELYFYIYKGVRKSRSVRFPDCSESGVQVELEGQSPNCCAPGC